MSFSNVGSDGQGGYVCHTCGTKTAFLSTNCPQCAIVENTKAMAEAVERQASGQCTRVCSSVPQPYNGSKFLSFILVIATFCLVMASSVGGWAGIAFLLGAGYTAVRAVNEWSDFK